MKEHGISLDEETVRAIFLDGAEGVLRTLMEQVLNQLLEARAEDKCGAGPYERTGARTDHGNGTRSRALATRLGKTGLEVPRLRGQSVAEGLFDKHRRPGQAIVAAVAEMVVKGVSTRDVDDVARALFGEGVPRSQAPGMCAVLDPVVEGFRSRELDAHRPFLVVDATYLKARGGGRVVSKAPCVALGVSTSGRGEVLGFALSDAEGKEGYGEFFSSLRARGPGRCDLVVSDDIAAVFALPRKRRIKLRTPDAVERADGEVRCRDRALRLRPSEGSVTRIIGTLLMELHDDWREGRVHLDMGEYLGRKNATAREAAEEKAAGKGERVA